MIGFRLWQIAGWTMLHYFWVGAALGAVALLTRQRLQSAAASVRYLFALGSLLLLSVAPAAIAVVVMQNLAPLPHHAPLPVQSPSQPEAMPLQQIRPTVAADTPAPAATASLPAEAPGTRNHEQLLAALNLAAMCLPWLWVCGAPLSFALTTAGLFGAERLRRQSRPLEDARITQMCQQLAAALNISYGVSVAICDRIAAPILVGVLRPMILLPATALAGWDPQQLEMVLLHELAHVRRCDNLVNLLQRIVESLLFFQPMVWIISGWVRRERENCCDELVVTRTRQPRAYAEILVTLAERLPQSTPRRSSLSHSRAVSSMGERPLIARIRRILKKEEQAMQVSRKAVGLMFAGLLTIVVLIDGYYSLPSHADDSSAVTAEPQGPFDTKSNQAREADSRAWYILSQTDTMGLLLGLPERLGKTIVPSRQQGPMWSGVENGGRLTLDVQIEGDASGEVFIGFFADPRWWLAEPAQVRRVPGPGRYTFDRLIPGKYQLGAMLGTPPKPVALGVHATWPAPVKIAAGRAAEARVLVSTKFKNLPAGVPGLKEGFAWQREKMDQSRMITVRTVDSAGEPVPFCRVTFVDRGDGTETLWFHDAGTDDQGYAYCDKIDRAFSLFVQRFDSLPGQLASRYEYRQLAKIYNAQDRPVITIKWGRFPTGTAKVVGQVHDQHKQALKQYHLTLTRRIGEQHGWSDSNEYAISLPVTDPEGRYEVADLSPGTYTAKVRHFDYSAYAWTLHGPVVVIPDTTNAVVRFNVEVEAKELLYGRAVHEDGTPVYPGSWIARLKTDITSPSGGKYSSMRTEKDGSFRVSLSREERQQLMVNSAGMIDVHASTPKARVQVPIKQLSKDPTRPFKVVVPEPGTATTAFSNSEEFEAVRDSVLAAIQENRARLPDCKLVWTHDNVGSVQAKMERGIDGKLSGTFEMYMKDGNVATKSTMDTVIESEGDETVSVERRSQRAAWNGKELRTILDVQPSVVRIRKSLRFLFNDDYLSTIRWRYHSFLQELRDGLPGTVVKAWAIEKSQSGRSLRVETQSAKGGSVRIWYALDKGSCREREEWYHVSGRKYAEMTQRIENVWNELWFPVELTVRSIDVDSGKTLVMNHCVVDLSESVFGDPSAIPDSVFDIAIKPEMTVYDFRGGPTITYTDVSAPLSLEELEKRVEEHRKRQESKEAE